MSLEYGLDAFLLLRFLHAAARLFAGLTVIVVPTLIPLNVTATGGRLALDGQTGLARLSWSNLPPDQWWRYWAHATACLLVVLYVSWVATAELAWLTHVRRRWLLRNPSRSSTVLVTDIPTSWLDGRLPSRLRNYFRRFAGTLARVQVVHDDCSLLSRIRRREHARVALETLAIRLDRQMSRNPAEPISPTARADLDRRVDQMHRADDDVQRAQHVSAATPLLPCAFLHFTDPASAHVLCQVRHHGGPPFLQVTRVDQATDDNVAWECIPLTTEQRTSRRTTASVCALVVAVVWVVPISTIGVLSQCDSLQGAIPALARLPPRVFAWLQGVVAAATLTLLMDAFPSLLSWMTRQQAHPTRSDAELSAQWLYFIFLYVQVFFVTSVSAALTVVIPRLIHNPTSVPALLAQNLPLASNYFLSYVPLSSCGRAAALVLRVSEWVWHLPGGAWSGNHRSPRSRWIGMRARSQLALGQVFPILSLLVCLGIIFSVMAPVILPGVTVSLALLAVVYRYLIQSVLDVPVDSVGLLYWQAWQQVWVGVYTLILCEMGLFGLVGARGPLCTMLALLVATATYHYFWTTRSGLRMTLLPASGEAERQTTTTPRNLRHPRLSTPNPILWLPDGAIAQLLRRDLAVSTAGLIRKRHGAIEWDGAPPDHLP